jgi:hypothetical protein
VPLLTHLPPRNHGVSLRVEAAPLAPARLLPGPMFWGRRSCYGERRPGSRPEIVSRRRSASKMRLLGTLRGHPHATEIEHARPGALNQANADWAAPAELKGGCRMPFRYNPSHWRERAVQMRALAVGTQDEEAAALMLKLAEDYDKLAGRVELRAQEQPQSKKN